ncbi:hypothetical protein N431DRAFT_450827 [Stipitochalara longipes BDJ]|nr:hypothetical protein N431DRAFT_450827 [Stipitochalara longipes BDJ]
MSPKFCISLPPFKRKLKSRIASSKSTDSHNNTIQSALSTAKQHITTLSRRGKPFPVKFRGPTGHALKLYNLLGRFEEEVREGAREMEGNLKGVGDFLIADQVLKDLEIVDKMFRKKVLTVLEQALEKDGVVDYEELIWETRKLRRRAGKALGGTCAENGMCTTHGSFRGH